MKDFSGFKNNLLTAKALSHIIKTKSFWVFKCDCGNEITKRVDKVLSKTPQFKSCGCLGRKKRALKIDEKINIEIDLNILEDKLILYLFNRYKKSAKQRLYSFDISFCFFKHLVIGDCFYCGQTPNRKQFYQYNKDVFVLLNGVDRKDNDIGYVENNCVTCCTICNRAKSNFSYNFFIEWIKRLKYSSTI